MRYTTTISTTKNNHHFTFFDYKLKPMSTKRVISLQQQMCSSNKELFPCKTSSCECNPSPSTTETDKEDDNATMVTVSTAASSLSSRESLYSTSRPRKVSFSTKHKYHKVESPSISSFSERQTLWYTPQELQCMKANTRKAAIHVLSEGAKDIFLCLRYSYDGSIMLSQSLADESNHCPREIDAAAQDIVTCMTEWASSSTLDGEACRGTEMMLLRRDQAFLAKEARKVVLVAGAGIAQNQREQSLNISREWEDVATRYGDFSRHAAVFAATMANADMYAMNSSL